MTETKNSPPIRHERGADTNTVGPVSEVNNTGREPGSKANASPFDNPAVNLKARENIADAKTKAEADARDREEVRKRRAEGGPYQASFIEKMFDSGPIPLGVRSEGLPSFPVGALPEPYRAMVEASAVAWQVDTAMAGPVALAAIAAACGGCVEAHPRAGWEEVAVLHVLVAARPSERKSALINVLTKPLVDAERALIEIVTPKITEALTRRAIAEHRAKDAEKAAAKPPKPVEDTAKTADAENTTAAKPLVTKEAGEAFKASQPKDDDDIEPTDPIEKAVWLARQVDAIKVPSQPRLLADDVTPEALGSLLADHRGRIAIMSAEGGIFDTLAGRYSNKVPSLDVWLKGYSGDPIRVDRKGRPAEMIDRPALTACLMLQPSVLTAISRNGDFRNRGLTARALFSLPVPMRGHRATNPDPVPEDVSKAYSEALSNLARELRAHDDEDYDRPPGVKFTPEAEREVTALLAETEPRLIDPDDFGGDMEAWGGKFVGNVVRIALLIHLAEHGADGVNKPVTAETFGAARRIGEFFAAHSVSALRSGSTSGDVTDAETVLTKLREMRDAAPYYGVNRRDLRRRMSGRLRQTSEFTAALHVLVAHNHVVLDTQRAQAGREKVFIYLHPDI